MLLVNVYLCCAITGSAKICCFPGSGTKDKSFDKRGSSNKPDEFDPYARSWHGSQYGSRWVPSIFLTTCVTKVLRFPLAHGVQFFLLLLSLLYLSTFYSGKPFIWLKSTTILVQLTFYLEFETFLRYFLRLWSSSECHFSRVQNKTWRKLICFSLLHFFFA